MHPWPSPPKRLLRVSAQIYNSLEEYEALAAALRAELNGGLGTGAAAEAERRQPPPGLQA